MKSINAYPITLTIIMCMYFACCGNTLTNSESKDSSHSYKSLDSIKLDSMNFKNKVITDLCSLKLNKNKYLSSFNFESPDWTRSELSEGKHRTRVSPQLEKIEYVNDSTIIARVYSTTGHGIYDGNIIIQKDSIYLFYWRTTPPTAGGYQQSICSYKILIDPKIKYNFAIRRLMCD